MKKDKIQDLNSDSNIPILLNVHSLNILIIEPQAVRIKKQDLIYVAYKKKIQYKDTNTLKINDKGASGWLS